MVALDVVRTMQLKINRIMAGKLKSIDGAQGITATEKFAVEALGL